MKNFINKKTIKFFIINIIITIFIFSCAPRKIVKTPLSVFKEEKIKITKEEFLYFKNLAVSGKTSFKRAKGTFWAGMFYLQQNKNKKAEEYFLHNEKYYKDTIWGFLSIYKLADIYFKNGEYENAFQKIKLLLNLRHQFPETKDYIFKKIEKYFSKIQEDDIHKIYNSHYHDIIDEYAIYFLCIKTFKNGESDKFFNYANIFFRDFKESKFYKEIEEKFKTLIKYKPVNNKKIAVILPLTGKAVKISDTIKNGVNLALEEYNQDKDKENQIKLIYINEDTSSDELVKSVIKAIEVDKVIAILGPLYSRTVKLLIPLINRYNIVLFSPTAALPDLPKQSEYFFRNCATAKGEGFAISKYILNKTEYKNIGVIYPDNPFGETLKNFFKERFENYGGKVIREAKFNPKTSDFKKQIVFLGGIDTIKLKAIRNSEKREIKRKMKEFGKRIINKIHEYINLYYDENSTKEEQRVVITLLHFAPYGEHIKKYNIDTDMTVNLSYAVAKDKKVKVLKQKVSDKAMEDIGVYPEDIDREIALNIAYQLNSDILIWGQISEEKTNTIYANLSPEIIIDENGNTKISYDIGEENYFYYNVTISVLSVADEEVLDEIYFKYKKLKDPIINPLSLDALYIPVSDRKMILIKDQLKFYDLELPVFGASTLLSNYIFNFKDTMDNTTFPADFYLESDNETTKDFIKKYSDKYAMPPDIFSANAYDAMNLICLILDKNITSRESFKDVLKSIRNYSSVTGEFSFDQYGDSVKDFDIIKIKDGNIEKVDTIVGD